LKQNHLVLLVVAALVAALAWIAATSLTGRDRRTASVPESARIARPAGGVYGNGNAAERATSPSGGARG
jgi:hypothetical protein